MKFILAEKKEMTQKFAENGDVIPVTRLVAGPCIVTQIKTSEADGYAAVQLGFGNRRKISRALKGHLKNWGTFRYLKEFRIDDGASLKIGDKITAATFGANDVVQVTGFSKGKGFQGVVKRHGFHGSPATHGHKDQLRMPGSIAAGGPQHVFKGTKMGGQMGGEQVTVKNLKVIEVKPETNEIFIRGAVPGAAGNLILIAGEGEIVLAAEETKPVEAAALTESAEIKPETEVKAETETKPEAKAEEKAESAEVKAEEVKAEEKKEVAAEEKKDEKNDEKKDDNKEVKK